MVLTISEIVSSLQGEGRFTGYPTTFIRLYGCNLRCSYCDSTYALKGKKKRMSIPTIMNYVFKMGNRHICITGGEPLVQDTIYVLVYELLERGYTVSIETNGAVAIDERNYMRSYSYCMDIKCPSSGMEHKNVYSNLEKLLSQDEVKFVIKDVVDYVFAKEILKKYPTKAQIIFSPVFIDGKHNGQQLSQWLLEDKIGNARVGIQMHRILDIY